MSRNCLSHGNTIMPEQEDDHDPRRGWHAKSPRDVRAELGVNAKVIPSFPNPRLRIPQTMSRIGTDALAFSFEHAALD